jgi:hypothetical protein
MDVAYDNAAWQAFFATIAGASAALIGLLFVALSLHLGAILSRPANLARARGALGGFVSLLAVAILALIPGQGPRLLGVELFAVGSVVVAASIRVQGEAIRLLPQADRSGRLLRLAPINLGTASLLIAGGGLVFGRGGGLFWLVPTVLLYLGNSLFNAWSLTVQIGEV